MHPFICKSLDPPLEVFTSIMLMCTNTEVCCIIEKYWRSPELLEIHGPSSQTGDVFSFGIILQEIITRTEPYEDYELTPIGKVYTVLFIIIFFVILGAIRYL